MSDDDFEIVRGSGNIFADFGDTDAETKLMKAKLAAEIVGVLDARKISVREAEKITGVAAADISRVRNADLAKFTLDRLLRILRRLAPMIEVSLTFSTRVAADERVAVY
ncbi:helix-turn-helix domain-containing protein [Rhizobium sp. TRM95796]|uniref:helix-turn-helix domain-containing protein n=1 Tax=Rhizobium sp. TRM95796 TaxID=2979862 RepID=UPI0021E7E01E|nr:helix-turn-helix domain-containing protein [Rhizobium sp. TRM95796]MCV3766615.1 helix-turn-helix domain-containing protein [Rhizobium sp. TRM95796]